MQPARLGRLVLSDDVGAAGLVLLLVSMITVTLVALYFGPETMDRDMDVDMFTALATQPNSATPPAQASTRVTPRLTPPLEERNTRDQATH